MQLFDAAAQNHGEGVFPKTKSKGIQLFDTEAQRHGEGVFPKASRIYTST